MATTLEIINGISQVLANSYDGALDENSEPVKIGLRREEGNPLLDSRIMDGFGAHICGDRLHIKYHAEIPLKEVHSNGFEGEMESMVEKVKSFLQNFFGEMSEEDCMRTATYIRAVRFDLGESVALKDESPEEHQAFLAEFKQLQLDGLYGFPLWEAEVHDLLHANFRELASIFRGYCKSLGEGSGDETAKTMDIEVPRLCH